MTVIWLFYEIINVLQFNVARNVVCVSAKLESNCQTQLNKKLKKKNGLFCFNVKLDSVGWLCEVKHRQCFVRKRSDLCEKVFHTEIIELIEFYIANRQVLS